MAVKKTKTKTEIKIKETPLKEKVPSVQKLADKLLELMGTKAKAVATEDKKNEAIRVDIEADAETGLLIGRHGETLDALQVILGMMIYQESKEWARIIVNVGDWREKQEDQLKSLALQAAERARETGEPQTLFNLNAAQRRIVHLVLTEEKDIETESSGEGKERYLVIQHKK
ncbi:KH domain-containing protein [Patescibacteria group bacterium]|nr:KH domain-containing protein [Patescibacteria group bacterium]MBU0776711.1 KH domain-containing protein [Patescibacteria group bacterium]MBU0846155.1 KH domain-containing protein [Patescibacteria group bacterium]MBU0922756.1 KH domain-containing protein [Patescibacteria group bacterium]MBU1066273.1 KH domain-containing protein [Patescibacteria group bacterium]